MIDADDKRRAKIMVVDDEVIIAEDVKSRLEALGYYVTNIAVSGTEAIEAAKKERPDLVLMDINLKGDMDGIDAATTIREWFGIPSIYLTAFSDNKTLEKAKVSMPFGYILKPFSERELHTNIEMALYRDKAEREIKTLKGLLPICATCKKIRDAKGYWQQVEQYIINHTEADFTHGICPDCAHKVLEEIRRA